MFTMPKLLTGGLHSNPPKWSWVNGSSSMSPSVILLKRLDNKFLARKIRRERVASKSIIVSTWLDEMELRCRDAEVTKWIHAVDEIDSINLEQMLNGESFRHH